MVQVWLIPYRWCYNDNFFTGILLVCKIDSRFNQLEKLIESKDKKPKDEQVEIKYPEE